MTSSRAGQVGFKGETGGLKELEWEGKVESGNGHRYDHLYGN